MNAKYFKTGLLLAVAAMLGTACDSDRDDNPTVSPDNNPSEFVLNTPALADQYIQLSAENKVHLTWSQPQYGYNAIATYQVEVGLVGNDGSITWAKKDVLDNDGNVVEENKNPYYLETTYTTCSAEVSGEEIAEAICKADNFRKPEQYQEMGFRKIAMRIRSVINDAANNYVEGTEVFSQPVYFNHMAAYNAVKDKTCLWVIGNCSGWTEPSAGNADKLADWRIWETAIGSKVYKGTVTMPDYSDSNLMFRFYSKLTGWDADSYGTQEADSPIVAVFGADGSFNGKIVKGKGSWQFDNFPGGDVEITVDMNKSTVNFQRK